MSVSAMRSYEHISAMPNRFICSMQGDLNASRPPCLRAVCARTCSPITLKVYCETVPAYRRQAFQLLLAKCVPEREFSKAFTSLLNSHASRVTGATKPRVLLMSGSAGECWLPRWGYMKASRPCRIVSYTPAGRSERKSTVRLRDFLGTYHATCSRTTKRCLARKGIETFAWREM